MTISSQLPINNTSRTDLRSFQQHPPGAPQLLTDPRRVFVLGGPNPFSDFRFAIVPRRLRLSCWQPNLALQNHDGRVRRTDQELQSPLVFAGVAGVTVVAQPLGLAAGAAVLAACQEAPPASCSANVNLEFMATYGSDEQDLQVSCNIANLNPFTPCQSTNDYFNLVYREQAGTFPTRYLPSNSKVVSLKTLNDKTSVDQATGLNKRQSDLYVVSVVENNGSKTYQLTLFKTTTFYDGKSLLLSTTRFSEFAPTKTTYTFTVPNEIDFEFHSLEFYNKLQTDPTKINAFLTWRQKSSPTDRVNAIFDTDLNPIVTNSYCNDNATNLVNTILQGSGAKFVPLEK